MNETYPHFEKVDNNYQIVARQFENIDDYNITDLSGSRDLFLFEKNSGIKPNPILVDVIALLSGISFEDKFLHYIKPFLHSISNFLHKSLHYIVEPENLGVEYAILKWPTDNLNYALLENIKSYIANLSIRPFTLHAYGFQAHKDGCIIIKAIDEDRRILNLRDSLFKLFNDLPKKQSSWTHIPVGRVLEPIGINKMRNFKAFIKELNEEISYKIKIDSVHLVNETQWYMRDKKYLLTKEFS